MLSGGDFGLEAKNVTIFDSCLGEGLRFLYLAAGVLVMKLVAEWRAVRPVLRQHQLVDQNRDVLVSRGVVRHLDRHTLVLR